MRLLRSRRIPESVTKLFILNQGQGPLLREFVAAAAQTIGPVAYATPDRFTLPADNVHEIALPRNRNSSMLARLWSWFTFLLIGGLRALIEPGRPVLFIVTNPPLAPLIGYVLKKVKRQRYVLLFYDLYPEAMERFAGLSPQSVVARAWRAMNRAAIRHADRVITISPHLAQTVAQYLPLNQVRIIPTWVDTDVIRPLPKAQNEFAARHAQSDKLTVLYSGNLGRVHDLALLPALAERLRAVPEVHFLIIGEGPGRAPLEAECARLRLSNVTFLPLQPEEGLLYSLACADIALVALAEGGEGVSMPSKTYYMLAAGAALLGLCRDGSDLAAVIDAQACGVHVPPHAVEQAAQAILQLRADSQAREQYRANGRRAAEQCYSRAVCVPQMVAVLQEVLD
jgi:glycosyltransferase involved in cell wall biosynthesis